MRIGFMTEYSEERVKFARKADARAVKYLFNNIFNSRPYSSTAVAFATGQGIFYQNWKSLGIAGRIRGKNLADLGINAATAKKQKINHNGKNYKCVVETFEGRQGEFFYKLIFRGQDYFARLRKKREKGEKITPKNFATGFRIIEAQLKATVSYTHLTLPTN